MFTGGKDNQNDAPVNSESPSQSLAELPAEDTGGVSLGGVNPDEYYGDGPDDGELEHASGRSFWLSSFGWLLIALACFGFGAMATNNSSKPLPLGPVAGTSETKAGSLMVHVAGQVKKPGVYTLPFEARVIDAITKAGGPLPDADLNALNLATWAEDGKQILVPVKAAAPQNAQSSAPAVEPPPEMAAAPPAPVMVAPLPAARAPKIEPRVKPASTTPPAAPKGTIDSVPHATTASGSESANASPEFLEKNPVDLNTSTVEQLQMLPGVGPAMAERILKHRQENGRFNTLDELDDVAGIGPKTLEKLRPLVTVK